MSFVVRSLQARGITELIPTVRIESQHSTGVPTCHEFPWFFSFWRNRGLKSEVVDEVHVSFDLFGKKTPYWQIFKNLFGKDSCGHGNTSSVQILWNLADRKSVKSCVIYLTKKNKISARILALASARIAPKICWTAPDNILGVPQISSKSVHFRRSYSRTREHRSNAP